MCKNEKQVVLFGKKSFLKIVTIIIETICPNVNGIINVMS
jgi:hypothetical protein